MEDDKLWDSINNTLEIEANSILELKNNLKKENLIQIINLLANCKGRILISGCGTSAQAAKKVAHSLCCIEIPAMYLNPSDAVHGGLGILKREDILILISKGGNTKELLNLIPSSKAKGAVVIGVTENEDSNLAKNANVLLKIKVSKEPDPFNMLATASTLSVIAVFDAICICLMRCTNYTKEKFAIIHPSGAVGERLLSGK